MLLVICIYVVCNFLRGNHKSYYGENFIVSNENVDTHIGEIEYASDVYALS